MSTGTDTEAGPPARATRRLERARSHRMIAGVCEGLGRYFEVDPVIFRIGFAVAAVAGGAGVLAYIVAVLVIPEEGARRPILSFGRETPTWVPWLLGILVFFALVGGFDHRRGFNVGWVLVLGLAGWFIWSHEQRHPRSRSGDPRPVAPDPTAAGTVDTVVDVNRAEPADEPRSILGRLTLSLLLVGAGVALALVEGNDVTGLDLEAFLGGALVVVGLALVVGAWWGRARALIALGILLTVGAAAASVVDVPLRGGFGERRWAPVADVRRGYRLGIGDAELDLTAARGRRIVSHVTQGVGHLRIVVPHDAAVDVDAHVGLGELHVLGRESDGRDLDEHVRSAGSELAPAITLDVRLGVGQVEVVRDAA